MNYYKDFNYVEYILNLSFKDGFKLYLKCIEREKLEFIKSVWLVEIANGCEQSFEEYRKMQEAENDKINMSDNEKQNEEERILKLVEGKKNTKMKEVKLI